MAALADFIAANDDAWRVRLGFSMGIAFAAGCCFAKLVEWLAR